MGRIKIAKMKRKDKLNALTDMYRELIRNPTENNTIVVFNQIIIDSVGMSGLLEVKRKAWKLIK